MDEEYDLIVCGTGLKECILSGLFSVAGKKVLHLDRNNYYGGECASLNITNLYEKFCPGQAPPKDFGANREWNVDLVPKLVMASGTLVKLLLHTKVTRYLEWKVIDGTFVYQYQAAGMLSSEKFIHKVPNTEMDALKSNLLGLMEKKRCANFFSFVQKWDETKRETLGDVDPRRNTMKQVYEKFSLDAKTIDFIGHAIALYNNDEYLNQPCGPTIAKVKLYFESFLRYGQSPFIYPIYGLGGLPEGFSRLSAIHGGTYMLNKPVDGFEYDAEGKVSGVRSGGETARGKMVICDPSYADPSKTRSIGKVIRCICILGAPIPKTNDAASAQIIIPQSELKRQYDVYISMVSSAHQIAKKGKYVAIVSTMVETNNPEQEILPALNLLGPIEAKFNSVTDLLVPLDNGLKDNVFVTSCYDPSSHFQSTSEEVLNIWRTINGTELDLNVNLEELDEDQ